MTPSSPRPLLTVRAALVLLLALITGLLTGVLTVLDGHSLAAAGLASGGATGVGLLLFHTIIGR